MAIMVKITCDTALADQPAPAITAPEFRCLSSTMEGITFSIETKDMAKAKARLSDAVRMANATGWMQHGGRLLCPGCVRRMRAHKSIQR